MKTIALTIAILTLSGCASISTTRFNPETKTTDTTKVFVFCQKSVLKGFSTFNQTKTASSAIKITSMENETQAEVVAAMTQAAVEGAIKGASKTVAP